MRTLQEVQALVFHTQHIPGLVGRPSFTISVEQIQALREGVFFRWTDIARILGVSTRTLSRGRQELGLSVGHGSNFSQISTPPWITWSDKF